MTDKLFRVISFLIAVASPALAGAPNAALADHCKGKHKNDPAWSGGGDDGGSSGVIFSVAFVGTFSLADMIYSPDP